MEFDEIVVKESPGLCRCCLSEGCYKDLGTEYTWMNETEVYADMLLECFDISITQHNEGPNGPNRLICEVCITRLRDACNFKKQVMDSEKKFIDMMGRGEFRPKMLIYQTQLKCEGPAAVEDPDDEDVEYLEDDIDFAEVNLKDELTQPSVSNAPVATPVKGKRGRPRKNTPVKPDKRAKVAKVDEKAKTSKAVAKGKKPRKYKGTESSSMRRRRNLQILFNNTSIIPFKWRGKYLCFYCSKDIAEYTELRKHTKAHGSCSIKDHSLKVLKGGQNMEIKVDISLITCEVCAETLPSFDEIVTHLFDKHELEYDKEVEMAIEEYKLADLSCTGCDEKFTYFGYLVSHVNNTHPKNCLICDNCNQKFNKRRDLFSHVKNYHREGGYQCEMCPQIFNSLNILRKHRNNRHLTRCNICHLKLPSAALRQKHIDLEHPDDGSLQCDTCFKEFHTKQGLKMHSRKCKGEEIFGIAIKEENVAMDLDLNYEDQSKKPCVKQIRENIVIVINMSTAIPFNFYKNKFNCFYCSKDFADSDLMREHAVMEHPVCDVKEKCIRKCRESVACVKIDISSLACKLCFESLTDLDHLIDHLIAKHDAKYDKSITTCLQPYRLIKDNMVCPHCPGEVFRFFGTLLKHMNIKHTNNNIICVYCGQTFRRDQNLRVHIWRHHRAGRFKCNICAAECNIPSRLYMHMARAHGVKAAKCPKCPESFATQYERQKHLIIAHNTGHKCSYCGKLFTRNSFMSNHIRRTHMKEKSIECSVCYTKFFNTVLLKRHMVKHSGQKKYSCDVCGERFYWRKTMKTHKDRLHNGLPGPYEGCTSERRRKNLKILFNHTTIMPFKWRGKYLCFYCGKNYTEYTEFRKHTKSHGLCTTKDYSLKLIKGNNIEIKIDVSEIGCDICNEPFSRFEEIIDHLISKHNMEYNKNIDIPFQEYRLVDFRCLYCEEQFSYFGYLVKHVNNVHPQNCFICDDCGVTFNKKRDLSIHLRNYHRQGGYPCDLCLKNFETRLMLRRHQNNMHFRHCKSCGLRFASLSLLQKHVQVDHPQNESNMKCSYCSKEFHTSLGLRQHISKCKVKIISQVELPQTSFLNDSNIEPKKKQNILQIRQNIQCVLNMSTAVPFKFFSKYSCFYCSKKFVEFDELRHHTSLEHPVCDLKSKCMKKCKGERIAVKIDISALACKICCLPMANLEDLVNHLINEHKANYDTSIPGCLEPFRVIKDNMPCPICPDTVFRYFGILLRHMNSEHSNNNRICDFCGRSFRNAANLNVHITYAHTGSCECDICGVKYKNQWCLARHRARTHDAKDHKCPKCPEQFQSQYHKQKHLIKMHNVGHKCSYCGKMFTRNSFMKDHVRRTHLKEKNIPCSICNEKFFDNYLLRMHMVKHEGDRKFSCTVCGKAFLRRSNLSSHMEMHKKYGHVQLQI